MVRLSPPPPTLSSSSCHTHTPKHAFPPPVLFLVGALSLHFLAPCLSEARALVRYLFCLLARRISFFSPHTLSLSSSPPPRALNLSRSFSLFISTGVTHGCAPPSLTRRCTRCGLQDSSLLSRLRLPLACFTLAPTSPLPPGDPLSHSRCLPLALPREPLPLVLIEPLSSSSCSSSSPPPLRSVSWSLFSALENARSSSFSPFSPLHLHCSPSPLSAAFPPFTCSSPSALSLSLSRSSLPRPFPSVPVHSPALLFSHSFPLFFR